MGSDFINCELDIATENQGRLSFDGRQHPGQPCLDGDLRHRLLATLDPEEYGQILFAALGDDLIAGYREALAISRHEEKKLRFRISISPAAVTDIHALNWELLFDPKEGLALGRSRKTALSRFLNVPLKPGSIAVTKPKVLVIFSCPVDLGDYGLSQIDKELQQQSFMESLDGLGKQVDWQTFDGPATAGGIRERLVGKAFHIVHLVAHGTLAAGEGLAHLVLENEDRRAHFVAESVLGEIFEGLPKLRLVVLMSCSGGQASGADQFSGLGPRLVRRGVPAVIAMRRAISLDTARSFTNHFYRNLALTQHVDVAVNEGRQQLYLQPPESCIWTNTDPLSETGGR